MKTSDLEYFARIRIGTKKEVDQFQREGWCVEDFYSFTIDPVIKELKELLEMKHLLNPMIIFQNNGTKSLIYYNTKGEFARI